MGDRVNQPSKLPTRKLAASGIASAVGGLIVWGLTLAGVEVPAEIVVFIITLVAFGIGYFVKDNKNI